MFDSFWMPTLTDLYRFSPELAIVTTIVVILVAPLIVGRSARNAGRIALIGALVTIVLTLRVADQARAGGLSILAPAGAEGMIILDNMTVFFKVVLMLFLCGVTILWFIGSSATERNGEEFFVLLLGSALGMMLMTSTLNLLMIVIAIELASLPSYAIVAFNKKNRLAAEASLKYVIFGAISTGVMLYGASLLYGLYQTLNLGDIAVGMVADFSSNHNTVIAGLAFACFLAGVAFKIAAVPFHFWCPDVFEGAQIEVTTWLSVSSKAAALVLLLRIVDLLTVAADAHSTVAQIPTLRGLAWGLGIVAAITCTWGNFAAYRQKNIKRLLAYSSIAHAGYMMMAAAVFTHPDSPLGFTPGSALLVYILIYVFMNLGAFGVTAMVVWQTGSEEIDAFSGLGRRAPWIAVPMVCCLVSLVGLPPFAGFIGKVWILMSLGQAGGTLYWGLMVVIVLNTLVSLFFYMRIIKAMFFTDDGKDSFVPPIAGVALVNICAVVLLACGVLFITQPRNIAQASTQNLFVPSALRILEPLQADASILNASTDPRPVSSKPSDG